MPELMGNYFKCLSWWEIILSVYLAHGPEEFYPKHEEAVCTLQGQVHAPLRPAPAGNANPGPGSALTGSAWNRLANNLSQNRIDQETMSPGMQGHL